MTGKIISSMVFKPVDPPYYSKYLLSSIAEIGYVYMVEIQSTHSTSPEYDFFNRMVNVRLELELKNLTQVCFIRFISESWLDWIIFGALSLESYSQCLIVLHFFPFFILFILFIFYYCCYYFGWGVDLKRWLLW